MINLIAGYIVLRWAIHEIAMLLITMALVLVLMAMRGMWWPLIAFVLFVAIGTWAIKRVARWLFPVDPEPQSLDELCAESAAISAWAAGNTFDNPPPAAARLATYGRSIHDVRPRERMVPSGR